MNEVTAALKLGRQRLVTNGWIREQYQGECGYCAVGAVREGGLLVEDRAVALLANCLPEGTPVMAGPYSTVFNWNDHVAHDIGDVLALFDRAIEASGTGYRFV